MWRRLCLEVQWGMTMHHDPSQYLSPEQTAQVRAWLGDLALVGDLSWNLTDNKVLHLRATQQDLILKTGGESNHHISRELRAHQSYTESLKVRGLASEMLFFNEKLRMMVFDYLPGALCEGSEYEFDPSIFRQAGSALKLFHSQHTRADRGYEERLLEKFRRLLSLEHRISFSQSQQIKRILDAQELHSALLVPTHGDWQPRNWIIDEGKLRVIDFGRFEFRPAASDLARLASQQFNGHAELESAFLEGYGEDPREEPSWGIMLLREAIGTAVWAYQVGDSRFEAQGHRMIQLALERFE